MFIGSPNLPDKKVTLCVASVDSEMGKKLSDIDISVISPNISKDLAKPVSSHADMLMHHLGNNNIVVAKKQNLLKAALEANGFHVRLSDNYLHKDYPRDILLNACRIGNVLIAKKDSLDTFILEYCENNGIRIINTNQGYAKCSLCIVDEKSIITADKSLYQTLSLNGFDVLLISPGNIDLPGYSYGFIGGCCGLINKGLLAFTGEIELHPDFMKIKEFLFSKNTEYISLRKGKLIDIGGIIPLIEQD